MQAISGHRHVVGAKDVQRRVSVTQDLWFVVNFASGPEGSIQYSFTGVYFL